MSVISDKIRAANDLVENTVQVKEWDNVTLLLISPTVQERLNMIEAYTEWEVDVDGNKVASLDQVKMAPALVVACAHDPETRERAFEADAMVWLMEKNGAVVDRISRLCLPLVGFADEGATEAGKDDSSTTPSGGTESASLVGSDAR